MTGRHKLTPLLWVCIAAMPLLAGCPAQRTSSDAQDATSAEPGASNEAFASLPERIEGYIAALNAGDVDQMFAFYAGGVSEDFRNRRSADEDRALYQRLTSDLGQLEIERIIRRSPDSVIVTVRSDRIDMPVQFVFDIEDERIDGLQVKIGGPPDGGADLAVDLPAGLDGQALTRSLDRQLTALASQDRFSGVVLLARNGKPFFYNAYGLADRKNGRPNEITTAFDVGSITKFVTRTAVAQFLQAGKLALGGRIIDYLPDYPNKDVAGTVTMQHLLDHSSGLGDIFNERWEGAPKDEYIEPRDFFALFADKPLSFEPGTSRRYSNAGFVVLGAIIETVSGRPFADYLEDSIFAPAGMTRSGLELRDGSNPSLAVGYAPLGEGGALVDNLGMLPIRGCPAGSSMHTAEDLLKLDQALRAGTLLDPQWTAWLYGDTEVRETADYEIGIAGGAPGVSAGFESDGYLTVVVLSNFDPPGGEALARQLFQALSAGGPDA